MYKVNVLYDKFLIAKCDIVKKTMEPGWGKDIVCRWNVSDIITQNMDVEYLKSKIDIKYSRGNVYEVLGCDGSVINPKDYYIFDEHECLNFIFNEF